MEQIANKCRNFYYPPSLLLLNNVNEYCVYIDGEQATHYKTVKFKSSGFAADHILSSSHPLCFNAL